MPVNIPEVRELGVKELGVRRVQRARTAPRLPDSQLLDSQLLRFLGDLSEEDPPVPIPNTVVKLLSPDGTARVTVWESRKSPG